MNAKQYKKLGFETLEDLEAFLSRKDVKTMIGENYDHYRELWLSKFDSAVNKAPKKKIKGAFNWLALGCFMIWAAYRKMYGLFWTVLLMLSALTFAEIYYDFDGTKGLTGAWIVLAFMSKDMYFQHLLGAVKKLDKMESQDERDRFLKRREGVSKLYAWLAFPVFCIVSIFVIAIASYISGNPF